MRKHICLFIVIFHTLLIGIHAQPRMLTSSITRSGQTFSTPNTIYKIQCYYDLKGKTIKIPNNCVLSFDGGCFYNGNIDFNNASIEAGLYQIFYNVGNAGRELKANVIEAAWFGAKGDNKSDDSGAIQKAIEFAHNNYEVGNPWDINRDSHCVTVHLHSGNFLLNTSLSIPSFIVLKGEGIGNTKLINNAKGEFLIYIGTRENAVYNVMVSDFTLFGQAKDNNAIFMHAVYSSLENLYIGNFKGSGVYAWQAYSSSISDCRFIYLGHNDKTAAMCFSGAKSGMGANDFRIFKCIIQGYTDTDRKPGGVGIDAQIGNGISVSVCSFQNLESGIVCGVLAQSLKIESSYFELLSSAVSGVLWGTVFSKNFITGVTNGVICTNSLRGCSITSNEISGSAANKLIVPYGKVDMMQENYIAGNWTSGYETTIDKSLITNFFNENSTNFMTTNYGHSYGVAKRYLEKK